jgi:hypothetical protein
MIAMTTGTPSIKSFFFCSWSIFYPANVGNEELAD